MKNKFLPYLLSSLFSLFLFSFSCKTNKQNHSQVTDNDSLTISIYKYPCFGKCPYYEAKLFASGYALFDGKRDTKNIGLFETIFDKSQLQELLDEAKTINYMTMADSFHNPGLADFPSTITSVKLNGKRKTIFNGVPYSPDELKQFEHRINIFFTDSTIKWRLIKKGEGDD
jgi:Domain of unknown function (DUF6438)